MQKKQTKKSRFQPIFDYMDERFAIIEADIADIKKTIDMLVVHMDKSERRWQENDRRFNRHMELLENHHKRITTLEHKR